MKEGKFEAVEITKEMLEECQIPKPKLGISQTFSNGDEYYEDENNICLNGFCVEKQEEDKWDVKQKSLAVKGELDGKEGK